jgi:outer membrane cobalamin receptor
MRTFTSLLLAIIISISAMARNGVVQIVGQVLDQKGEAVDFATVTVKQSGAEAYTDEKGNYRIAITSGTYTLSAWASGYESQEKSVTVPNHGKVVVNFVLKDKPEILEELVVTGSGVSKVRNSSYNAIAIDTKELANTNKNLADALGKAPGMKLRETGGVGSDMQLSMDGFSGKHVKVFIDGVPQEGVGSSFGVNNIPVNMANRIEIYKGVVPVGFGTDAIGGVINIVTNRNRKTWNVDASYSYGSFNTHKSYVDVSQNLKNGFHWQINAFQNYSDNNYWIDNSVKDFVTGAIDRDNVEHIKRFHNNYHNEAVVGKVGFLDVKWADRFLVGMTYSRMYQEIQNGVRQDIVYGQKHKHGYSLMPSVEYVKRGLLNDRLDVTATANYNHNITNNVDTAMVQYNWRGETKALNSPGEQSYQLLKAISNNMNATATVNYRIARGHSITVNHVVNTFRRSNTNLLYAEPLTDPIAKVTTKNITGLSYRIMTSRVWNVTAFGKYYSQYVSGPIATTSNSEEYVKTSRSTSDWGFGAAGTYYIVPELQAKLSYERALRLPTIEEMFGDEDLEMGDMSIKPEKSHNVNFNLCWNRKYGQHGLYVEGGLIYRDTRDYIQRNITNLSGGKQAATYINYGKVLTKGFTVSARYSFDKWASVGGNLTSMSVRDNMKTMKGSNNANITYKDRIPNQPYLFSDIDVNLYWHGFGSKNNMLQMTYDNQFTKSFCYYASSIGADNSDYMVPNQWSHNFSITYSISRGKYNLSFECRNLTDAKLYDNFSLQKPGRAFYGKIRVCFGGK